MGRDPRRLLLVFAAALAVGARPARAEPTTVRSEQFNFEISTPDSEDWTSEPVDEAKSATVKARFVTEYADSSPPAGATVELQVMPFHDAQVSYERQAARWKDLFEAHLDKPRERSEGAVQVAGVDGYRVDVKGDDPAGVQQVTYYIARNGKLQYLLLVTRRYAAVGDKWLDQEIGQIVKSFKFLTIAQPDAEAAPEDGAKPGDGAAPREETDPALLAVERIENDFWRFRCVKPEGLLRLEVSPEEQALKVKLKLRNDRDGARLMIRVHADTAGNARWTLAQLLERRLREFQEYDKVTRMLDPVVDRRCEFPLAEEAIRLEMVGRSTVRIKRIWILADCRNERQYQLEIYLTGTNGDEVWGPTIRQFLAGFEPYGKKG